jgi:hypothetical protein
MDCQTVQNQILGLPDPRELSPVLRQHVQTCAACQEWARLAARLEGILEQISVPPPPGEKKETMLGELMAADPVILTMPAPAQRPGFGTVALQFLRTNATYVAGLAAAVLIVTGIAWMMWPGGPGPEMAQKSHKYPLLEKTARRNVELARADTPAKRLDVLFGWADDIATEGRGMAHLASGEELKQVAGWYEDVVKSDRGLVGQTVALQGQPTVPLNEKKQQLESLARKLGDEADRTEKMVGEARQDAQPALKRIAAAAREGKQKLQAAAEGK